MHTSPSDLTNDMMIGMLHAHYGLEITDIDFLPLGYDVHAAVYRAVAHNQCEYFLKLRRAPLNQPSLQVPRLLLDAGITQVLAPIRTQTGALWCEIERYTAVLYPFIRGENAMVAGMNAAEWRMFGTTLRAIHESGLERQLSDVLPHETFGFVAGKRIRQMQATVEAAQYRSPGELAFAAFWREYWPQIADCLVHAERLGQQLQSVPFEHVLCHADIHAANIMIATSGEIYLVDWDGPLIAPRERDLLFVVGSVIARPVLPHEEELFFETYGQVSIDQTALAYYRFERALEDLGETGAAILLDDKLSEEEKQAELPLMRSFFVPDGIIELAYKAIRS